MCTAIDVTKCSFTRITHQPKVAREVEYGQVSLQKRQATRYGAGKTCLLNPKLDGAVQGVIGRFWVWCKNRVLNRAESGAAKACVGERENLILYIS